MNLPVTPCLFAVFAVKGQGWRQTPGCLYLSTTKLITLPPAPPPFLPNSLLERRTTHFCLQTLSKAKANMFHMPCLVFNGYQAMISATRPRTAVVLQHSTWFRRRRAEQNRD